MVNIKSVWQWYSRESVQKALVEVGKNREVVSVFQDGSFGRRPDVIQYPQDILQSVAEGTISFHGSVEQWSNPMELSIGMSKPDIDKLRIGWSFVIDPDVKDFDIAKIVTKEMMDALKKHGIKNYSVKFTGGKGFHIGVPFESFPDRINLQSTSSMYPSMFQTMIEYLKSYTRDSLKEKLLNFDDAENLAKRVGKNLGDVITDNEFDPFKIVSMDIFGMRHLFRMPFSLHESSLLVSLPIKPDRLNQFQKEDATVEKAKVEEKFLISRENKDGEAFVVEALDWGSKNNIKVKEDLPVTRKFMKVKEIPETFFPPCIKYILDNGMGDGKKRALFILITFMRNMGWSDEKIQDRIIEWNGKNIPPLSASYLRAQLRWHFRQDRNLLPPNCVNDVFYKQMGLYDMCCKQIDHKNIKNPVNVPLRRMANKKNKAR